MNKLMIAKRWIGAWVGVRVISLPLALTSGVLFAAPTCPFDNGGSDAVNDGVVLTRYALGIAGTPLTANTRYASLDPLQVKANIECEGCALDINGDGVVDAVDAAIVARHLAGFQGASLTAGLALGVGTRSTTAAVTSFLANGCAVGGNLNAFVQGGNAFGATAVLGTTDAQPITVKSGGNEANLILSDGSGLRITRGTLPLTPSTTNGALSNFVSDGVVGAVVAGGGTPSGGNVVTGNYGVIGGGANNGADVFGTVAGGNANFAANYAAMGGGQLNQATGLYSVVPGGRRNNALGDYSIASGSGATATNAYEFVWSGSSTGFNPAAAGIWSGQTAGTFNAKADNGIYFAAGAVNCSLSAAATGWQCSSDRDLKDGIRAVDPKTVLAKVASLPISTWFIKGYEQLHLGPMAQDFRAAFGLGASDKVINSTDAQGVALAAIQGLHALVLAKDAEIAALQAKAKKVDALEREIAAIKRKLKLH